MHFVLTIVVFIIFFNIFMWIIFLKKFNSFFSTDKIIDETNEKAKEIIKSINSTVGMGINLIEDKIEQLKSISNEAEKRIEVLKKEVSISEKSKKVQQKILDSYSARTRSSFIQGDLFFRNEVPKEKVEAEPNIIENLEVSASEDSSTSMPEFFVSKDPIVPKKTFNSQVKEFYLLGLSPDEIASKTGRSVQEVRLAIDLI